MPRQSKLATQRTLPNPTRKTARLLASSKPMAFRHRISVVAFGFVAACATAAENQSFAERVALAKKVEAQDSTTEYFQNSMYPAIGPALASAMRDCMSRAGASTSKFAVVADISQDGRFLHVAHDPNTNTATCLATAMKSFRAPPPPMYDGDAHLPIVIEMLIQ